MNENTYFQITSLALAPAGQDPKKKLAAMVPTEPGKGLVRLRTKTSSDSLPEDVRTPQRKLAFTPTPPSSKSSSFLDSSSSL